MTYVCIKSVVMLSMFPIKQDNSQNVHYINKIRSAYYYTRDLNSCIFMLGIVYHMYYNNMQRPHQFTRNVKAEEQYAKEATDQLTILKGKMNTRCQTHYMDT